MVEQAEGVEGVTDDFCDGPGRHEQKNAVFTLDLRREERYKEHRQNSTTCQFNEYFLVENHAVMSAMLSLQFNEATHHTKITSKMEACQISLIQKIVTQA